MKSIAPYRTIQSPINTNVSRVMTRSMAAIKTPRQQVNFDQTQSTPLELHERRQSFLFQTPSTAAMTSDSSSSSNSILGGMPRQPPNRFMRFVHDRITPSWQQFQPRAVQFLKQHKRKIGAGLGIIEGTAIASGTLGATIGKQSAEPFNQAISEEMPVGQSIYSGGGGGSGSLSPYSGLIKQRIVRRKHKQKRKARKNIKKRKSVKNYLKLKSSRKFKRRSKKSKSKSYRKRKFLAF